MPGRHQSLCQCLCKRNIFYCRLRPIWNPNSEPAHHVVGRSRLQATDDSLVQQTCHLFSEIRETNESLSTGVSCWHCTYRIQHVWMCTAASRYSFGHISSWWFRGCKPWSLNHGIRYGCVNVHDKPADVYLELGNQKGEMGRHKMAN